MLARIVDDVPGHETAAGPHLDDMERSGLAKRLPHGLQVDGNERAEGGVGGWAGVVVSVSRVLTVVGVVPTIGVIERHLHELGKRDGAVRLDAPADLCLGGVLHVRTKLHQTKRDTSWGVPGTISSIVPVSNRTWSPLVPRSRSYWRRSSSPWNRPGPSPKSARNS